MKKTGITIAGYKFKDGKLVPNVKRFDASKQRRIAGSKRTKVVTRAQAIGIKKK